jgi:hypothetical protein
MADPIEHDGLSATGTVAGKAVKYGVLGGLAVVAGGALLGALAGIAAVGLASTVLTLGYVGFGAAASSGLGVVAGIAGAVLGGAGSLSLGGIGALVGGMLGVAKGGEQVSRENQASRSRVAGKQNTVAKAFSDGEVKGIQEGYQIARADMEPVAQKREQVAFQKGQEFVVNQIQEHMNSQMQEKPAAAVKAGGFAQKEMAKGGGITLQCESKAKAILEQRVVNGLAAKEI